MALGDLFGHGKKAHGKKRRKAGGAAGHSGTHHPDMDAMRKEAEEAVAERIAHAKQFREVKERAKTVSVTTGDLRQEYEILGPVYYQISNKGMFSNALEDLKDRYRVQLEHRKRAGLLSDTGSASLDPLSRELSLGHEDFEAAFFIAVEELKIRAALLGADAIVAMRQDIDIDTTGFSYFYLQMYGTAVKIKE